MLFQVQIHQLHGEDEFCPFHIMFSFPTKLMGTMFPALLHKNSNLHLWLFHFLLYESGIPKIKALSYLYLPLHLDGFSLLPSLPALIVPRIFISQDFHNKASQIGWLTQQNFVVSWFQPEMRSPESRYQQGQFLPRATQEKSAPCFFPNFQQVPN